MAVENVGVPFSLFGGEALLIPMKEIYLLQTSPTYLL
jgi:hypothetical protein